MSGYYPAGVTDSHPHFNPPGEVVQALECESDEVIVVPSFKVKEHIIALSQKLEHLQGQKTSVALALLPSLLLELTKFREEVEELEDNADWNCPWTGELELPAQQADVEWDCPTCGSTHKTDTIDEGPDPDRAYEDARDARYDD